ncbi:MAG: recombinase family protein [Methylocystaceae bacterium]|nr:recombinase family protein [Methylocystaceae bacterium]
MTNVLHIYTRVSTSIQEMEGTSLKSQEELGIQKANDLGFQYKLWNEGGQSSRYEDLNNRPVLRKLLLEIEDGKVEHVFVFNTDRLSRNQRT